MKKLSILLLVLSFVITEVVNAQDYKLLLANRTVQKNDNLNDQNVSNFIHALPKYEGFYYGIVQFHKIPSESDKSLLFERGIELLDYVPNYAYYAKIKTSLIIEDVSNIRMIYELNSFDRLRSDLSSDKYPSHAFSENQLKLQIQTVSEMDLGKLVLEIENNNFLICSIIISKPLSETLQ